MSFNDKPPNFQSPKLQTFKNNLKLNVDSINNNETQKSSKKLPFFFAKPVISEQNSYYDQYKKE